MRQLVSVTFNGKSFSAYPGDVLLDAALLNGVGIPHDCRSGECDTCVVRVLSGRTLGGERGEAGFVHACQARVLTNIEVTTEARPAAASSAGRVTSVTHLTEDVTEVAIEVPQPFAIRPGQYVLAEFSGFPQRIFNPTPSLDARIQDGLMRFHVRRMPNGRVSSELGRAITAGHRVKLNGPHGVAYLRHGVQSRLILVSGGTGFAPIWAIADAALRERPNRSILMIVGVRSVASLYMVQALDMMATCPGVRILVTSEEKQSVTPVILAGRAIDYLPPMLSRDVVYAAGPTPLVAAVGEAAAVSGASFYGEAFVAAAEGEERGWLRRVFSRRTRLSAASLSVPKPQESASLQARLQAVPSPREPRRVADSRPVQR